MEVGDVLKSVEDEYCEDFYKYYLHDFVRLAHNSQHKKQEQEQEEYNVSIVGHCSFYDNWGYPERNPHKTVQLLSGGGGGGTSITCTPP